MPAASSTVTNISETATATATANDDSGVVPPSTTSVSIFIGVPIVFRISSERSRFSRASSPKRRTRSSWLRASEFGGSWACAARTIAFERSSPSTSILPPSSGSEMSPPVTIRLR